jgi:tRNA-dihydrouridine synthase C
VIANGEIWSVEDYELCQQRSHCNSIMIGRGAMVKPYLAKEIKYHLSAGDNQEAFQPLSWTAVCLLLIDLFERMSANQELPERYIAPRLKLWVKWLMPTYEQAEAIFDKLKVIKDSKQAVELIKHYRS